MWGNRAQLYGHHVLIMVPKEQLLRGSALFFTHDRKKCLVALLHGVTSGLPKQTSQACKCDVGALSPL